MAAPCPPPAAAPIAAPLPAPISAPPTARCAGSYGLVHAAKANKDTTAIDAGTIRSLAISMPSCATATRTTYSPDRTSELICVNRRLKCSDARKSGDARNGEVDRTRGRSEGPVQEQSEAFEAQRLSARHQAAAVPHQDLDPIGQVHCRPAVDELRSAPARIAAGRRATMRRGYDSGKRSWPRSI